MFEPILCVTNRKLCGNSFPEQIERIAQAKPGAILLREKDLSAEAYQALAAQVLDCCKRYQVPCILHSFPEVAAALHANAFHAPLPLLRQMPAALKQRFQRLGTSCHSLEDAQEAERLGCHYLIAGHIFATDCKKGLPGRGLDFLRQLCDGVSVPVFAIGGICPENYPLVRRQHAAGACVMSGLMQCEQPAAYLNAFRKAEEHLYDIS